MASHSIAGGKEFDDTASLLEAYTTLYRGYQSLENSAHPSNSSEYQVSYVFEL